MGGTPYNPAKDGGGHSFKCFCIYAPMCANSDLLPTNLLTYWTKNNIQHGPWKLMF